MRQISSDFLPQRRRDIETFADFLVKEKSIRAPKVDPRLWVDGKRVRLIEMSLRKECDSLIRFRGRHFYIILNNTGVRARFSLSHELGHYLLPEHNQIIREGHGQHASRTDFLSSSTIEREADWFAAALLMPPSLFKPPDPNFGKILKVAEEFDVSVTSATLRTVNLSSIPVAVIMVQSGTICWCLSSEDMAYRGFHNRSVRKGQKPPKDSRTFEALSKGLSNAPLLPVQGETIYSEEWFDLERDSKVKLWEEVLPLAKYDRILTILIPAGY